MSEVRVGGELRRSPLCRSAGSSVDGREYQVVDWSTDRLNVPTLAKHPSHPPPSLWSGESIGWLKTLLMSAPSCKPMRSVMWKDLVHAEIDAIGRRTIQSVADGDTGLGVKVSAHAGKTGTHSGSTGIRLKHLLRGSPLITARTEVALKSPTASSVPEATLPGRTGSQSSHT